MTITITLTNGEQTFGPEAVNLPDGAAPHAAAQEGQAALWALINDYAATQTSAANGVERRLTAD